MLNSEQCKTLLPIHLLFSLHISPILFTAWGPEMFLACLIPIVFFYLVWLIHSVTQCEI